MDTDTNVYDCLLTVNTVVICFFSSSSFFFFFSSSFYLFFWGWGVGGWGDGTNSWIEIREIGRGLVFNDLKVRRRIFY